jgi:hypothetical protein
VGPLKGDHHQRFHLTPLADLLRTEAPALLRPFALLSEEEWDWRAVESAQSLLDAAGITALYPRCRRLLPDAAQRW